MATDHNCCMQNKAGLRLSRTLLSMHETGSIFLSAFLLLTFATAAAADCSIPARATAVNSDWQRRRFAREPRSTLLCPAAAGAEASALALAILDLSAFSFFDFLSFFPERASGSSLPPRHTASTAAITPCAARVQPNDHAPSLRTIAVAAAAFSERIAGCEQLLKDRVVVALNVVGGEAGGR